MKAAFYYAEQGNHSDQAIAIWTRGPFSHVELVLDQSKFPGLYPGSLIREHDFGGSLCFSSSPRDGGCRFKTIDLNDGKWKLVDLPSLDRGAVEECGKLVGLDYDWMGILGFVLPFGEHGPRDRFCSEAVSEILIELGVLPSSVQPYRVSPNQLFDMLA